MREQFVDPEPDLALPSCPVVVTAPTYFDQKETMPRPNVYDEQNDDRGRRELRSQVREALWSAHPTRPDIRIRGPPRYRDELGRFLTSD